MKVLKAQGIYTELSRLARWVLREEAELIRPSTVILATRESCHLITATHRMTRTTTNAMKALRAVRTT